MCGLPKRSRDDLPSLLSFKNGSELGWQSKGHQVNGTTKLEGRASYSMGSETSASPAAQQPKAEAGTNFLSEDFAKARG